MLTSWIPQQTLAALSEGFVVAINLEAKVGEAEAVAEILRAMTPPTMAEPGVKLFLPYRSPTNPSHFFIFELYVNEAGWKAHEATEHFKNAIEGLLPRLSRRERVPLCSVHQEVTCSIIRRCASATLPMERPAPGGRPRCSWLAAARTTPPAKRDQRLLGGR